MSDIKKKVYDITLVVQDIKEFPQTYKSILKEHESNGTLQTILRRKLSKLCKNGIICKSDLEHELLGINIEDLRSVENVVCIGGGVEKVNGIIAAANKQYFNILLTDDITASEILSILEDSE